VGTMNNLIGGTVSGAGNLISGNQLNGVSITNGASNNFVQGNKIGTDVSGNPLGNGTYGVYIHNGASNNIIGGTAQGAGNMIAANTLDGVYISDSATTGNIVQGNYIGGNGANGVSLGNGASNTTIGGTAGGAGNTIASNGNDGVLIDAGTGNAVLHNSIFGNSNLGIELLNGGNNAQPAPQLTSAVAGGGVTTVRGTLTGQASTTYTLEFYAADSSGQGQQFLGSVTVTTDENGLATFSVDLAGELLPGQLVTATATDPNNNTSEFSQAVPVGV
jgi:hypothetical protein